MTHDELITKAWQMANCEHSDTADMLNALANALKEADKRIAALRAGLKWFADCDNSADWIRADGILTDDKEKES